VNRKFGSVAIASLVAADLPVSSVAQGESSSPPAFLCSIVIVLLLLFSPCANATIRYEVSIAHPEQHLFHVSVEVPDVQGELNLQMAAWNALYEIRDFSSHVQQVQAYASGQPASIDKVDKLTWRVLGSGTITVRYDTFWDDPGPFNSQLNSEHAFINPAMILLYIPGRRMEKCELLVTDLPAGWRVASATPWGSSRSSAAVTYNTQAASFDALADAPIEASNFEEFTLHDLSPPIRVVVHGDNYKKHELESALRRIVTYETKLMEDTPYDQYTFIFHVGKAAGGAGGGMEHANSTAIFAPSGPYLVSVSAHEFFHLWNVKRIRPASLEPVDFTHEMYSRALWFAEGVTNTYGSYTLVRTELWNKQEFYLDLGAQITELQVCPAELSQSAEQSSLDAWLEKLAAHNQPRCSASYYAKGQVLGVLLDILIRDRTDNQRSLDDVLRAMNREFAKSGKFYRDSLDIRRTAEKIAGGSLEDFFANYVSGSKPLPYADLFSKAGLLLLEKEEVRATLGFSLQHEPSGRWIVAGVEPGSRAEKAGLKEGDEILRWNSDDIPRRPDRWASQQKAGDELHLRIRRAEKEESIDLQLGELRQKFYRVAEAADPGERARRIRDGMLRGTTGLLTALTH
jgi:predicted metalloprotease with PDZ domain